MSIQIYKDFADTCLNLNEALEKAEKLVNLNGENSKSIRELINYVLELASAVDNLTLLYKPHQNGLPNYTENVETLRYIIIKITNSAAEKETRFRADLYKDITRIRTNLEKWQPSSNRRTEGSSAPTTI